MAQIHKFQDLEESGKILLDFISSSQLEKLRQVEVERQSLFDSHTAKRNEVAQISQEFEEISQKLFDMQEEKKQRNQELENLEEQLRQHSAKSQICDSEIQFLKKELENLKNSEHELEALETEVVEDTTEIIPSAIYAAQLYYIISKIKWEFDTEPNILKGVHYGADLATPINIDTSTRTPSEVSDQLWGFVNTEW